jgi:hypothetical protein
MTELSPVAQAVLDAWSDNTLYTRDEEPRALAAALRTAVAQVTPISTNGRQTKIRKELLAIANELEAQ